MRAPGLAIVLLFIASACGCGRAQPQLSQDFYAPPGKAATAPAEAAIASREDAEGELPPGAATARNAAPGLKRMIVYNAEIELAVERFSEVAERIAALAEQFGGYLADSTVSGMPGESRRGQWRIRVPAARFQALLDAFRPLGEVRSLSTGSNDVSEEFYDVEARVRNQKQEETRLLKLLDERTGKLEEVLAVEREIARVRGETERLEGRLRVLTDLTSLSTVTLRVVEISAYHPAEEATFATRLGRSFRDSLEALIVFAQGMAVLFAAAAPWLVVLGVLFAAALIVRRQLRGRRGRGAPAGA